MKFLSYNRSTVTILLSSIFLSLGFFMSPLTAEACFYSAGPRPQIADIISTTTLIWPGPLSRTDIGAGEQVKCGIDASSWSDTDFNTVTQQYDADEMGVVYWYAEGQCTVPPNSLGNSVIMTAAKASGLGTVVVNIWDSGQKYIERAVKTKTFTVYLPSSVSYTFYADVSPSYPAYLGNGHGFGAGATFFCDLNPQTVNFSNLIIRENIQATSHTWPNGIAWNIPQSYWPPSGGVTVNSTLNRMTDVCNDGGVRPRATLNVNNDKDGPKTTSNMEIPVKLEYQNGSNWLDLSITVYHRWTWNANLTAQTFCNSAQSGVQGAWHYAD